MSKTPAWKPLIYISPFDDRSSESQISPDSDITKINNAEDNQDSQSLSIPKFVAYAALAEIVSIVPFGSIAGRLFAEYAVNQITDRKKSTSQDASNQKSDEDNRDRKIVNILDKLNLSSWTSFVDQISYLSIPNNLDFPPGHPLPGRLYRVHPLKKKDNRYIPVEVFDSILYKERESELIKLLVDLGATDICVQEISSNKTQGSAEGKANLTGVGGGSVEAKEESQRFSSADQIIKLKPKNWTPENYKSDEYSWLPYEPDWESLVHARIKGGCFSSSVELTSDTSFSISAQLGLTEGLLENLGSLGVGGEFSRVRQEKKRFKVTFIDV